MRASPIFEHAPPASENAPVERHDSTPGTLARSPEAELDPREADAGPVSSIDAPPPPAMPKPTSSPASVIAEANAMASQAPDAAGFLNAVMTYTFLPGAIFRVFTAPNNVTDLVLEPGEELMGEPASGDTLRWRLGVGTSAVAGVPQKHIYIKPTRAGLATNLTLTTDRRTYFVKLESVETDCMVAVQWTYPLDQASGQRGASAPPADSQVGGTPPPAPTDVSALNFDYAVEILEGKPAWKPRAVYDDGAKTYIRFDQAILHGEAPALFVVERDSMQVVNYRVKGDLYIVDRLFQTAELRLGQDEQDVVRLRNRRRSRAPAPESKRSSSPSTRRPGTPL